MSPRSNTNLGTVAVITGASSGIGRDLAVQLSQRGMRVGLIARRGDRLQELQLEIESAGGTCAYQVVDVRDGTAVRAAIERLARLLGPIDLLIASAGVAPVESVEPIAIHDVRMMLEVNFLGVVHACAAVLPDMLARRKGHIAAISSLAAFKGLPSCAGYAASKAAVNTFLEGLRIELYGRGLAISTICPGYIETPMTQNNDGPMPGLMSSKAAAQKIIGAIERRRKLWCFPWQTALMVSVSRWLPDWLMARLSPRELPRQH